MEVFGKQTKINFLGVRRFAAILSVVIIAAGVTSLLTRGLNLGIDFTGGVLVEVAYEDGADLPDIRDRLTQGGFDNALVQSFGSANDVLIRVLPEEDEGVEAAPEDAEDRNKSAAVGDQIEALLAAGGTKVDLRRTEFVGPQVGQELTERGGLAMLFAVIMILIYIMIRFQWKFAVGSVAALIHDVLVTIGIFSIFQFPFDLSVLAAILAVIGYSLNDTNRRVRSNSRKLSADPARRRRGDHEHLDQPDAGPHGDYKFDDDAGVTRPVFPGRRVGTRIFVSANYRYCGWYLFIDLHCQCVRAGVRCYDR